MSLDLLRRGLKIPHLRLLAELSRHEKVTDAAVVLGIAQPAASRMISEIENIIEAEVCVRMGRGVELTAIGQYLADRSIRILQEFSDTGLAIEQHKKGLKGNVRIGSVTGPAVEHVMPALEQIRQRYDDISVFVEVGASTALASMLEVGGLDFSLSRLPSTASRAIFEEHPLDNEPACVIARSDHPVFAAGGKVSAKSLLAYDWVLPPDNAPLRISIEQAFRANGVRPPDAFVTVSSFLFALTVVQQSDVLAPVARSVADSFAIMKRTGGGISVVPTELPLNLDTFSLLTRKGQILAPAAQLVAREIVRHVTGEELQLAVE